MGPLCEAIINSPVRFLSLSFSARKTSLWMIVCYMHRRLKSHLRHYIVSFKLLYHPPSPLYTKKQYIVGWEGDIT